MDRPSRLGLRFVGQQVCVPELLLAGWVGAPAVWPTDGARRSSHRDGGTAVVVLSLPRIDVLEEETRLAPQSYHCWHTHVLWYLLAYHPLLLDVVDSFMSLTAHRYDTLLSLIIKKNYICRYLKSISVTDMIIICFNQAFKHLTSFLLENSEWS